MHIIRKKPVDNTDKGRKIPSIFLPQLTLSTFDTSRQNAIVAATIAGAIIAVLLGWSRLLWLPATQPWPLLVLVVISPLAEEYLFRGWMQPAIAKRSSWTLAIPATAAAFAASHALHGGLVAALAVFAPGLALGAIAWRGRRGWIDSLIAHTAWNAALIAGSLLPH